MKLKDFETPFEEPPSMMELLVLKGEALPVLCVGCTRDKATRAKFLALINPNWPPEKVGKHMHAELGWVRVRAGREDCANANYTSFVQVLWSVRYVFLVPLVVGLLW